MTESNRALDTSIPPQHHSPRQPSESGWRWFLPLATAIFVALILLLFVRVFARTVALLALSIAIADSFAPVISLMERKMSRTAAAALIYGGLLVALAATVVFVVPPLASELVAFLSQAPDLLSAVQNRIATWIPNFSLPPGFTPQDIASLLAPEIVSWPLAAGKSVLTGALVFFLSFYWLVAAPSIHAFVRSLFPSNLHDDVNDVLRCINRAMGGYLRGVAINAAVIGVLVWIGLHFAGIPYAFPLGLISAAGEFVPYLGSVLAALPGVLVAAVESPQKAIIAAVIYLAVIQIEGHVLTPNVMKSQTDLPQVIIILALFAGGAIGGVLGALAAVPLAGAALVLIKTLLVPLVQRWTHDRFGKQETVIMDEL